MGGTALLFLSSVRTCPSYCVVRDQQATLTAISHLDELESQPLASWEFRLIAHLTLLLIRTTKHYFSKSSRVTCVCICLYVFLCMSRSMCATAQVRGQPGVSGPSFHPVWDRVSLLFAMCTRRLCGGYSPVCLPPHCRSKVQMQSATPGFTCFMGIWTQVFTITQQVLYPLSHLPYIKCFWVQIGLEIMVHAEAGWSTTASWRQIQVL